MPGLPRRARRRCLEIYGDGRQTRDFTYVGDVVAAVLAAGAVDGVGGEAYNIGGGSRVSLAATLELPAAIAGRPLDVRHHEALGFVPGFDPRTGLAAGFEWVLERSRERRAMASTG